MLTGFGLDFRQQDFHAFCVHRGLAFGIVKVGVLLENGKVKSQPQFVITFATRNLTGKLESGVVNVAVQMQADASALLDSVILIGLDHLIS